MENKRYSCNISYFRSYLSTQIISFIEYKVNICGCVPESFISVMKRFDTHCCLYPEIKICLKQETVLKFLGKGELKSSSTKRITTTLRSFAKYLVAVLQLNDVYVIPNLIKRRDESFIPYIFSHSEIATLLETINKYSFWKYSATPNMLNCIPCIFTMLYCTGMRVSEVSNLKVGDIDLEQRIIHINHAKNDNRRIVTISQTLADACCEYLEKSEKLPLSSVYFFDSGNFHKDGYVSSRRIYVYFRRFLDSAGIEHKGRGYGPRLHDIRVTFAVHSLQQLSKLPGDINTHIISLSEFMGHRSIYETQDYLWLTNELFQDVLDKMENYTSFVSGIFAEKVGEWDAE